MKKRLMALLIFILCILQATTVFAKGNNSYSGNDSSGNSYSGSTSGSAYSGYDAGSGGDYYGSYSGTTVEIHSHGGGGWGGGGGSDGGGGGGGGPVCTDYTETIDAPDFEISKVVPLVVKNSYRALVCVNVHNKGTKEATTKVAVQIGSETIAMSDVKVPAGNHALSYGYYTPKAVGKYDIKVTLNSTHPTAVAPHMTSCNSCRGCDYSYEEGAEYSYSDNEWKRTDR